MRIIKVALYKNSKTLFGKLIRWKQSYRFSLNYAKYTHAELVFEDGLSFSSSEVDGGTRFKKINFKSENWDFIQLEMSDSKYNKVLEFCKQETNKKYNWVGIFFVQILNFRLKGKGDWFCSEICTRALQQAHYLCSHDSLFIEPAELSFLLERR